MTDYTPSKTQYLPPESDLFTELDADTVWDNWHAKIAKIDYERRVLPQVRKDLQDMIADFPAGFKRECRRRYLLQQVQENESPDAKLRAAIDQYLGRARITDADIQRAKDYPIRTLLTVKRGYLAVCPFHTDDTPSMDTRNNFFHCYSCGKHGSTIDLIMQRDNLSFTDAVLKLCAM